MNHVYFDLETERSAEEVGGWRNIEQLGMAVGVTCARRDDTENGPVFKVFLRDQIDALLQELRAADCVVGFNTRGFDFRVLQPFADFDVKSLPNIDLMLDLKEVAGFRPSLGNCCQSTWGEAKSASGLQSLEWWREGRHEEVIAYCRHDVALTRRLHEWGAQHGHVLCREKSGRTRTLPVQWTLDALGAAPPAQQGSLF